LNGRLQSTHTFVGRSPFFTCLPHSVGREAPPPLLLLLLLLHAARSAPRSVPRSVPPPCMRASMAAA
jgi:hypothetical protein